jgi:hypothetical protein
MFSFMTGLEDQLFPPWHGCCRWSHALGSGVDEGVEVVTQLPGQVFVVLREYCGSGRPGAVGYGLPIVGKGRGGCLPRASAVAVDCCSPTLGWPVLAEPVAQPLLEKIQEGRHRGRAVVIGVTLMGRCRLGIAEYRTTVVIPRLNSRSHCDH